MGYNQTPPHLPVEALEGRLVVVPDPLRRRHRWRGPRGGVRSSHVACDSPEGGGANCICGKLSGAGAPGRGLGAGHAGGHELELLHVDGHSEKGGGGPADQARWPRHSLRGRGGRERKGRGGPLTPNWTGFISNACTMGIRRRAAQRAPQSTSSLKDTGDHSTGGGGTSDGFVPPTSHVERGRSTTDSDPLARGPRESWPGNEDGPRSGWERVYCCVSIGRLAEITAPCNRAKDALITRRRV